MGSEIFQEILRILIIKEKYIKNETLIASTLFRNPRKESGIMLRKFCAMLSHKNLVLAVSRI